MQYVLPLFWNGPAPYRLAPHLCRAAPASYRAALFPGLEEDEGEQLPVRFSKLLISSRDDGADDPRAGQGQRILSLLAILLAFWAGWGCPGKPAGPTIGKLPVITSEDPQAEVEIREARELLDRGAIEEAEKRYREFLQNRPADPLVPVANLALGRIELARGRVGEARELFAKVASHPDPAISEQGRFYDGVAAHLQGDNRLAIATLKPMQGRTIDPGDTSLLLRTLAAAQEGIGDYRGALETLDALVHEAVPESDREEARAEIKAIAASKATAEQITSAYKELDREKTAWPHVARRALRDADRAGDVERMNEILEDMEDEDVELDEELEALALRAARPTEANPRAVGAILSLSGRARKVGEQALRGLMLAAGLPPQGPPGPDAAQVIFRDDGGDAERAVEAVNELVSTHRVVAIVGPIEARAAAAAAERAQELGIPLIALTPTSEISKTGPMVFRLFTAPEYEVQRLVKHAIGTGAKRFAVLHPDAPFGSVMRDTFSREVERQGGQTVAVQSYPPEATSFGPQISKLAGSRFDALFIADSSSKIALIAPALAAADLWSTPPGGAVPGKGRAITVLAPSVGFDPSLAAKAGRYLQGAVFSAPFDPAAVGGPAQQFAERFQKQFGSSPDMFAAFAHDAYGLIREAVKKGARTREQVAESLPSVRYPSPAGPSTGFNAAREPLRAARLLELRGDHFVEAESR
jgi:branched-chain amino acid transport system substrate-binding protein